MSWGRQHSFSQLSAIIPEETSNSSALYNSNSAFWNIFVGDLVFGIWVVQGHAHCRVGEHYKETPLYPYRWHVWKRFSVRKKKTLEAFILYLSCGWQSSDDKTVNLSVLWVQKKFQLSQVEMSSFVKAPLKLHLQKDVFLHSCQNAITCTVAHANPWEYFHE